MAEVFLAKVAGPGGFEKMVVLKRILPSLADNVTYVRMFLSEARLAAQLDHPNIVHVFDFGESEGNYFLTMEYVEGANLRQVLRWAIRGGSPIAAPIAARIISNACEGLAYAHEFTPPGGSEITRLVHRDVSPENIMLSRIGAVKLLDFGVAKSSAEDHRSKVGSLKGKIAYMPPEQVRGIDIDHRVDIYALGVVLYQVLSGKRPYGQATDVALITAILQEEPTPLLKHRLDLPDNLLDIVNKAMAKDPAKRFQSCAEMRDALEAYIAHEGQPVTSSQIAQLVAAYQLENPETTMRSGLASGGPSGSSGVSAASEASSRSRTPTDDSDVSSQNDSTGKTGQELGVIDALMSEAARTNPRMRMIDLPPEPPTKPEGLLPRIQAAVPVPVATGVPIAPAPPRPPEPRPSIPTPLPMPPEAAAPAAPAQARRWTPRATAAEPIRHALREALRADRSSHLLRKLPAVIGRLTDFSRTIPWQITEALAGVIDAAVLADDHHAIVRIIDRAEAKPGRERRFANLVAAELQSPLRFAWLVERLRAGLPADTSALRAWLGRLGPGAGQLLVDALESSDPGPVQELFAEALAEALPSDPSLVINRLEVPQPKLRNVAALCFALERSQLSERSRVFQTLIGRRDPALQVEVMLGRAKARPADALPMLEANLGDRSEEVRKRAVELIGELGGAKGFALLERIMSEPAFEARPGAERARHWAALLECGGDAALAAIDQALQQKASLLNKKKVVEAKLTVIEGLARARSEVARACLERTANDKAQGDEVQAAAAAALAGARPRTLELPTPQVKAVGEARVRLLARVSLDLALVARAATTIDVSTGLLDNAIQQFREGLRLLIAQDGRMQFLTTEAGPTINGAPVSFAPFHDAVAPAVTQALLARNVRGLLVDASLPMAELRSFFLRVCDPDGKRERLPHIKALDASGLPLMAGADGPAPLDPTGRARDLFAALVRWLHAQREGLRRGRPVELGQIEAALEEWSRLVSDGTALFMGVERWSAGDTGVLVHAVNTAALSMVFAQDLGLPRSAVREACELALMLGLTEAVGPPEKWPKPGEPTAEDQRFHAAGLMLTNRLNRLGTSAAIGAVESGMDADPSGRGPGTLSSIIALAKTYDALTAGQGLSAGQALEAMNGRLSKRFSADLVGLFTQWAFAQAGSSDRSP